MIIKSHTGQKPLNESAEDEGEFLPITDEMAGAMLGEDSELIDITVGALTESYNLDIAMARFEHENEIATRSLNEADEGAEEKKEGFVKEKAAAAWEFIKRQGEALKNFWIRVKTWIVAAVKNLVTRVFGARESWLKENEAALLAAKDFGTAHANVGDKLRQNGVRGIFDKCAAASEVLISEAKNAKPAEAKSIIDRIRDVIAQRMAIRKDADSDAAAMNEAWIGETASVAIDSALVRDLVAVAKSTFDNLDKMRGVQMIADGGIRVAQGIATASGGDPEERHAVVKALGATGPRVSALIGACVSVNSRANAQAMTALVSALKASQKPAKAEGGDEKKPMNEDAGGSLLDKYL